MPLFRETIDGVLASGATALEYVRSKAGATEARPKISRAGDYEPWDRVVARGVDLDDVAAAAGAAEPGRSPRATAPRPGRRGGWQGRWNDACTSLGASWIHAPSEECPP